VRRGRAARPPPRGGGSASRWGNGSATGPDSKESTACQTVPHAPPGIVRGNGPGDWGRPRHRTARSEAASDDDAPCDGIALAHSLPRLNREVGRSRSRNRGVGRTRWSAENPNLGEGWPMLGGSSTLVGGRGARVGYPWTMTPLAELIGRSPGISAVRLTAERLLERRSDRGRLPPVLIQGETGVGKGLLARALHRGSPRG